MFLIFGQATCHSQFQTMQNSMDANKQLHDACPASHSNLLSVCRLVMVTSLSNLTAHLSGNCALHTAVKVLINTNYTNIFEGKGYLAIYSSLAAYDKVYKRLPKPDEHVE
jgi:hypothetical protein